MADPFVAEIRIVGFSFPPKGWAHCNGQLLPLSQNTALFALLGTVYGGDGKSTFALPDIRDSAVISDGQGPGLSYRQQGEVSGSESVTLLQSEIPVHTHSVNSNIGLATLGTGGPTTAFARSVGGNAYKGGPANVDLAFESLAPTGGSLPHNNMMPYLTLSFVIALQGVFPQRP